MRLLPLTSLLAACTLPVDPRPACGEYLDCVRALDEAEGVTTDVARYLDDGACWEGDEIADLCERSCVNGLAFLRARAEGLPEACR